MKMTKGEPRKHCYQESLEDGGLLGLKVTDKIVFKYINNRFKRKESEVLHGWKRKQG